MPQAGLRRKGREKKGEEGGKGEGKKGKGERGAREMQIWREEREKGERKRRIPKSELDSMPKLTLREEKQ